MVLFLTLSLAHGIASDASPFRKIHARRNLLWRNESRSLDRVKCHCKRGILHAGLGETERAHRRCRLLMVLA